jgi:hypothetical protein
VPTQVDRYRFMYVSEEIQESMSFGAGFEVVERRRVDHHTSSRRTSFVYLCGFRTDAMRKFYDLEGDSRAARGGMSCRLAECFRRSSGAAVGVAEVASAHPLRQCVHFLASSPSLASGSPLLSPPQRVYCVLASPALMMRLLLDGLFQRAVVRHGSL